MKYRTDEMILAAHIRDLAMELRNNDLSYALLVWQQEWPSKTGTPQPGLMDLEKTKYHRQWLATHNLKPYVLQAIEHLEGIASLIQKPD